MHQKRGTPFENDIFRWRVGKTSKFSVFKNTLVYVYDLISFSNFIREPFNYTIITYILLYLVVYIKSWLFNSFSSTLNTRRDERYRIRFASNGLASQTRKWCVAKELTQISQGCCRSNFLLKTFQMTRLWLTIYAKTWPLVTRNRFDLGWSFLQVHKSSTSLYSFLKT